MKRRVLISVGGTGGHIYPAIALAQKLKDKDRSVELLFVGGNLSANRFFDRNALPYKNVSCGTLSTKNPFKSFLNIGHILRGIWESREAIREFQPDVIVGFGSYHSFPTMLAAKLCRIPILLHASDSMPGKVIRLFSRFAVATSIQFPETAQWLQGKSVEVDMPLRDGFKLGSCSQSDARAYFNLKEDCTTLLVFGGSQGAAFINEMAADAIVEHLQECVDKLQIIHLTGNSKTSDELQIKYQQAGFRACVKDFETKMELAWQAASFVLSRAGAATIAEQREFEVPGILIPYRHAADNHQEKNALFMVHSIGCAEMLTEPHLNKHLLAQSIHSFLENGNKKQQEMKEAIRLYKKNHKPIDLCSLVLGQLNKENRI